MKIQNNWIEEELTIVEFAEKFLGLNDFETIDEFDLRDKKIEILGKDLNKNVDCYKPINSFIVKQSEAEYWTDGKLNGTGNHRIIENGENIYLKDHKDFTKVDKKINVVDFEIDEIKNYYANGRLNHNTTSGGYAIGFAASTRIRLSKATKIKDKEGEIIGLYIKAKIIKSRFGPTHRTVEFPLYFSSGIDNDGSLLLYLKNKKLVKSAGAWYTLEMIDENTGEVEEIKFQSKNWTDKLNDIPGLRDYVYNLVCENFIMKYICDNRIDIDTLSIEVEKDEDEDENFVKLVNSSEKDDDEFIDDDGDND